MAPLRQAVKPSAWERLRPTVTFLGGPSRYASVKIRCLQIATALGCEARTEEHGRDPVPDRTRITICVKPSLDLEDLDRLGRRTQLVWDVHDEHPPELPEGTILLCSTEHARRYLADALAKSSHVIPHHHANLSAVPNPRRSRRRACWIGGPRWVPARLPANVTRIDSKLLDATALHAAYRSMDVAYNFRGDHPDAALHLALNPGLKALNAMGYGLPAVSPREPAYVELTRAANILCHDEGEAAEHVDRLLADDAYYDHWRLRALRHERRFRIHSIADEYRRFLAEVDA